MSTSYYLYCADCEIAGTECRLGYRGLLYAVKKLDVLVEEEEWSSEWRLIGFNLGFSHWSIPRDGGDIRDLLEFMAHHFAGGHRFVVLTEFGDAVTLAKLAEHRFYDAWPWLEGRMSDLST